MTVELDNEMDSSDNAAVSTRVNTNLEQRRLGAVLNRPHVDAGFVEVLHLSHGGTLIGGDRFLEQH